MGKEDAPNREKPSPSGRVQINMRLTEFERDFIRERSESLHMTMSEYVIKRSVYDAQGAAGESPDSSEPLLDSMSAAWDQLRSSSAALSELRDHAAYISRDTRSALARGLSRRMLDMCDAIERDMVPALSAVGDAFGSARPRRR